ncbi:hypothetical protein MauCBS54593_007454 [Microsporum audouinii]
MSQPSYVTYARMDEHMADMVTPDGHGYAEPMFNEPALEPWMDGVLDETLMMAAPSSWDNFDSLDAALAQATPNAFDSMLADYSLPIDGQASSGSSNDLTVSPDVLNISSNLAYADGEMAYMGNEMNNSFSSFDSTADASGSVQSSEPLAGDHCEIFFEQVASAFKDLARARAAADPRPISRKQKQRDASIALYLERLRDTCNEAVAALNSSADDTTAAWAMSSQRSSSGGSTFSTSNGLSSSSSPSEGCVEFYSQPQSSRPSVPSQSPALDQSRSQSQQPSPPAASSGGIELVMDLNMNAATSLPRRHRPRTETQRQRYLAVRNHGACEKHKKQHKRCTCIDKAIPLTTSPSSQASIHASADVSATSSGVKSGKAVHKTSSLRRVPGARGGRDSLSPTSGEDIWPGLCHNGEALVRTNKHMSTVKNGAGETGISTQSLQQQGGLDHSHGPGHNIGNSHDKGLSRYRGASGDGVSTLPANTGRKRGATALSGALDKNSCIHSRPNYSCSPVQGRSLADYNSHCQNNGVFVNTTKKTLLNRDQSHPTVKNSSLLVFPDGTMNSGPSFFGQLPKNTQKKSICGTNGLQHTSCVHDWNSRGERQKPLNDVKCNRDGCHLKSSSAMTNDYRAHILTHLPPNVHLALPHTAYPSNTRDGYLESTPSVLRRPPGSTLSPAYPGLRWFIRACNHQMLSHSKRITLYQREYALWCVIWMMILLLSTLFKGALV